MGSGEIDLRFPPSSRPSTPAIVCAALGFIALLLPLLAAAVVGVTASGDGLSFAPLHAAYLTALPCGIAAIVLGVCAVLGRAHAGWAPIVLGLLPVLLHIIALGSQVR